MELFPLNQEKKVPKVKKILTREELSQNSKNYIKILKATKAININLAERRNKKYLITYEIIEPKPMLLKPTKVKYAGKVINDWDDFIIN